MLQSLKARYAQLIATAKGKIAVWFGRKPSPRGLWFSGKHRESSGALVFAPFIPPVRAYHLYLPADFRADEPVPLLVMLHGCKQDAKTFAAGTRVNLLADRERFVVLYPEQRRLANPYRCWNWFDPSSHAGHGEAAIVVGMVRAIAQQYNIDNTRVYVAGISAGGATASILTSCYADVFAAGAVHSGLMFQAASSVAMAQSTMRHGSQHDPQRAGQDAFDICGRQVADMPMMVIHGDQDRTVDPVNAEQIMTQFTVMNRLIAQANNIAFDETRREQLIAPSGNRYGYQLRDVGEPKLLLRQVTIHGLAHAWSGGDSNYPYNDARGPHAIELMWSFFALHQRRKKSS